MHNTPDAADEILANPETDESLYSTLPKLPSLYTDFCMGRLNTSVTGLQTFNRRLRLPAEDFSDGWSRRTWHSRIAPSQSTTARRRHFPYRLWGISSRVLIPLYSLVPKEVTGTVFHATIRHAVATVPIHESTADLSTDKSAVSSDRVKPALLGTPLEERPPFAYLTLGGIEPKPDAYIVRSPPRQDRVFGDQRSIHSK